MKKNMTANTNAASYINLVMNTIVELTFDHKKNNQLEHIINDHGLLRLKPEPINHEEIAETIQKMDDEGDFDPKKYQDIALTFQCYEFVSDELGIFIDNYDSATKLLSNEISGNEKKSTFQVRNYISLGSIIPKGMLEESVQKICADNETARDKLAAILSKILICTLPNEEVLTEEGVAFNMEHIISEVQIEEDNKFIQFANEMRNSD